MPKIGDFVKIYTPLGKPTTFKDGEIAKVIRKSFFDGDNTSYIKFDNGEELCYFDWALRVISLIGAGND